MSRTGEAGNVIAFDKWQSIGGATFMALVGYAVMVAVPVLTTALVQKVGLLPEQAGSVWAADLGGFSVGAVLAALTVARVNRRHLVLGGVILSVAANALSFIPLEFETLMAVRAVAGIGSGIFTAVAVVTLGGTTRPVVAFNILLVGFAVSTALEVNMFGKLTMNEIYQVFLVLSLMCAVVTRWIPAHPLDADELLEQAAIEDQSANWRVPVYVPVLCLIAVMFTYINIGGYYTFISEAALKDGVSDEWVVWTLTWASFFGLVGCVFAYFATRFGMYKPLFVSLLAIAISVIMVSVGVNRVNIVISLFAFFALWTFADVYQSAMLSYMDRKGSMLALLPSVQGFGQSIGGFVGSWILAKEMGYSEVFLVSGGMAIIALGIYMIIYMIASRQENQVAIEAVA
jgi:predicted MFS family arabinose efflux permease